MKNRKIGFLQATALVSGNMIGTGILLLPTSLAVFGYFSLWGWLISTIGALLLAIVFSRLSRILPLTGGPYIYTNKAFGNLAGFIVGWGYWIAIWTGNAAIVIAFIACLTSFFPILNHSSILASSVAIITVWALTFLNLKGVREASHFQVLTTILKTVPLIIMGTIGFFFFKADNFFVQPEQLKYNDIIFQTAALTLWSFLGIESATVPAAHIRNPEKNIPRATMAGTILSAVVFISSCTAVMGILSHQQLLNSAAPFADAAQLMGGKIFYFIIAATAIVACLGTLNGWILLQGQIAFSAANDGVFPAFFRKQNKNNVPTNGLIISSVLTTLLICVNYSETLQKQFQNVILLSTLSTLIPYVFCSVAEINILRKDQCFKWTQHWKLLTLSILALTFSIAAIIGTGTKSIIFGLILLIAGLPFYFLSKRIRKSSSNQTLAVDEPL